MVVKILTQFELPGFPRGTHRDAQMILEERMAMAAARVLTEFNAAFGSQAITESGTRLEEMPEDEPCKQPSRH